MSADPPPNWKTAYFDALHGRRDGARRIEQRSVTYRDGSLPELNQCHPNAERFVEENPGHTVVRGWLLTCQWDTSTLFDAHSVVADAAGRLIEITPMRDGISLPFLPHEGSEAAFADLRATCGQMAWPPLDVNQWQLVPDEDDWSTGSF